MANVNNIIAELVGTAFQGTTCFAATVFIHGTAAGSWLALSLRLNRAGRTNGEKNCKKDGNLFSDHARNVWSI